MLLCRLVLSRAELSLHSGWGLNEGMQQDGSVKLAPINRCCITVLPLCRDNAKIAGLSPAEAVVLSARPRSPSQQQRLGFSGSWSPNPSTLSNSYFKLLLEQDWKVGGGNGCPDKVTDRHWQGLLQLLLSLRDTTTA
jgi:hypothetical protein